MDKKKPIMITPTQELLRAEKHIDNEDYDTARNILESLDNPTAKEWLEHLDEIAPVKKNLLVLTCGTLFWLFVFAMLSTLFLIFSSRLITIVHLSTVGQSTEGQIVERYTNSGGRNRSNYLVYTFEVDGSVYTHTTNSVFIWVYEAHPESTTVTIRYDAAYPDLSMMEGTEPPVLLSLVILIMVFTMTYSLYTLYGIFKVIKLRRRKQKRKIKPSP